jgi:hypothetical protein
MNAIDATMVINALQPGASTHVFPIVQVGSGGTAIEAPLRFADTESDLADRISTAKQTSNTTKRTIIQLTTTFYTAAASKVGPIVIDPGPKEKDNTAPYTIRGLGKENTDPTLPVGMLLANDNITLDRVRITIDSADSATKAAPTSWEFGSGTETGYKAAVSIGRWTMNNSTPTTLTPANLPANKVTISNCDIRIDNSSSSTTDVYTAGIFVSAAHTDNDLYAAREITISNNKIYAVGKDGNATQGIYIGSYNYSIKITDNTIDARYGVDQTGKRYGAPASALFFSNVCGESIIGNSASPQISGNTLVLDTTSPNDKRYAYSFFINAVEKFDPAYRNTNAGVTNLRKDYFATAATRWALKTSTDTDSYKKLFNALLSNITGTANKGFGSVSIPWSAKTTTPYSTTAFEYEHYHIEKGKVTRISVLGDHIVGGAYAGDSEKNVFNPSETTASGVDYGSFTVGSDEITPGAKNEKFYFTYSQQDTDFTY